MKYFTFLLLFSLIIGKKVFSQIRGNNLADTITFKFEKGDVIKKFFHKGRENISTIYISQGNTYEYFYSNTRLVQKYSIGKVYHLGHDTLILVSDTSMYIDNASDLIKKNKYLNQYFFQDFDHVKFVCSNKALLLVTPVTNLNSRKGLIKVKDLKRH